MDEHTVLRHKKRRESTPPKIDDSEPSFYAEIAGALEEVRRLDVQLAEVKSLVSTMDVESETTVNQIKTRIAAQKKELDRLVELNDEFQQKLVQKLSGE